MKDAKLQGVNFEGALFEKMMIEGREVPPCDLSDAVFANQGPEPFKQGHCRIKGAAAYRWGEGDNRPLAPLRRAKKMRVVRMKRITKRRIQNKTRMRRMRTARGLAWIAKLVNAVDRTLDSLITVSKEFLVTFDEQLRDPLNAELQALERETAL